MNASERTRQKSIPLDFLDIFGTYLDLVNNEIVILDPGNIVPRNYLSSKKILKIILANFEKLFLTITIFFGDCKKCF